MTRDWTRLEGFFDRLNKDVYPEPPTASHAATMRMMYDWLQARTPLPRPAKILDVGCGQGVALELFSGEKHDAVGITLGDDVAVCRSKGFDVREMDLSFMEFGDSTFDMVWCRHALEHSVFPYFTLSELSRVLKPNGVLYVEVPAPDTICRHQDNPNHYSVLGKSMWLSLMRRSGFQLIEHTDLNVKTAVGPDMYWAFLLRRSDGAALAKAPATAVVPIPSASVVPVAAPPEPAAQQRSRQGVVIQFTMSSFYGWGVYGLNVGLHWANDPEVFPLFSVPVRTDELAVDRLRRDILNVVLAESEMLRRQRLKSVSDDAQVNVPVISALSERLSAFRSKEVPFLIGKPNIGVTFFVDTVLGKEGLNEAKKYALIVAGSSWNRDLMLANGIKQSALVLQGIDPTVFHPGPRAGLFPDRFLVFSGGKFEYRKSQDLVMKAFAVFSQRHPEALLVTAWHSPWPKLAQTVQIHPGVPPVPFSKTGQPDIPAWAAAFGVREGAVLDLGAVPNVQMPVILREMDVAVFPNRCEPGTNLVAMECMACGLPVILSRNTGHTDIIGDDDCYPLNRQKPVPPFPPLTLGTDGWGESDSEEIVEALEAAWQNRDEARRRGLKAAAKMAELSWGNQMRLLRDMIKPYFP